MPTPSLEKVMESFDALDDSSDPRPLLEYTKHIDSLAVDGKLHVDAVRDLIEPQHDVSAQMGEIADRALSERVQHVAGSRELPFLPGYFHPGYVAVISDAEGHILGVKDHPHPDSEIARGLAKYGGGLRWAFRKLGDQRYTTTHREDARYEGRDEELAVHEAVARARDGRPLAAIPFGEQPHMGGASFRADSGQGGGDRFYAGVSGVVARRALTSPLSGLEVDHKALGHIVEEAYGDQKGILDDFDGNLLAGSLDTSLATLLLATKGLIVPVEGRFAERAVNEAVQRRAKGINVH